MQPLQRIVVGGMAVLGVVACLLRTLWRGEKKGAKRVEDRKAALIRTLREEHEREQCTLATLQGAQLALKSSEVHRAFLSTWIVRGEPLSPRTPGHKDPSDRFESALPQSLQLAEGDEPIAPGAELLGIARRVVARVNEDLEPETVLWLQIEGDMLCVCIPPASAGVRVPIYAGIAGLVARRGQEKLVRDTTKSSLFNSRLDTALRIQTRESVCAPVHAPDGRVMGVVMAINRCKPGAVASPQESGGGSFLTRPSDLIRSPNTRLVDSLMFDERGDSPHSACRPSTFPFTEHDLYQLLQLCEDGGTALARLMLLREPALPPEQSLKDIDRQASSMCAPEKSLMARLSTTSLTSVSSTGSASIRRRNSDAGMSPASPLPAFTLAIASSPSFAGSGRFLDRRSSSPGWFNFDTKQPSPGTPTRVSPPKGARSPKARSPKPWSPSQQTRLPSPHMPPLKITTQMAKPVVRQGSLSRQTFAVPNHIDVDYPGDEPPSAWGHTPVALPPTPHALPPTPHHLHSVPLCATCDGPCLTQGRTYDGSLAYELHWGFDPSPLPHSMLRQYAVDMYASLGLLRHFDMDQCRVANFVQTISRLYSNDVPYHNFTRGDPATRAARRGGPRRVMIRDTSVGASFGPIDRLALLTAALCVRVGHHGYSNSFFINSLHEAARTYNDKHIVEHLSCSLIFQVLSQPHSDMFAMLQADTYKRVRKAIIQSILAMDVEAHVSHIAQLRVGCELMQVSGTFPFDHQKLDDVQFLLGAALKAACLAKQTVLLQQAKLWSALDVQERLKQAKLEREMRLPITYQVESAEDKAQHQMMHVKSSFLPFWRCFSILFPDMKFAQLQLESNLAYYQDSYLILMRDGGEDHPTGAVPRKMKEISGRQFMTSSIIQRQTAKHENFFTRDEEEELLEHIRNQARPVSPLRLNVPDETKTNMSMSLDERGEWDDSDDEAGPNTDHPIKRWMRRHSMTSLPDPPSSMFVEKARVKQEECVRRLELEGTSKQGSIDVLPDSVADATVSMRAVDGLDDGESPLASFVRGADPTKRGMTWESGKPRLLREGVDSQQIKRTASCASTFRSTNSL